MFIWLIDCQLNLKLAFRNPSWRLQGCTSMSDVVVQITKLGWLKCASLAQNSASRLRYGSSVSYCTSLCYARPVISEVHKCKWANLSVCCWWFWITILTIPSHNTDELISVWTTHHCRCMGQKRRWLESASKQLNALWPQHKWRCKFWDLQARCWMRDGCDMDESVV